MRQREGPPADPCAVVKGVVNGSTRGAARHPTRSKAVVDTYGNFRCCGTGNVPESAIAELRLGKDSSGLSTRIRELSADHLKAAMRWKWPRATPPTLEGRLVLAAADFSCITRPIHSSGTRDVKPPLGCHRVANWKKPSIDRTAKESDPVVGICIPPEAT